MEEWKDIEGYEGFYQVSSLGFIRSLDRYIECSDGRIYLCKGRVLSFFKGTTCNYKSVQLSRDNAPRKFMVHRLVAKAFLGLTDEEKLEVNHKDGNTSNNQLSNLELVSRQQNIDHAIATGLKHDYGENHVHAKLTNAQATEARKLWHDGMRQKDIAIKFGVSKQTINNIVHYKSYFR